MPEASARRKPLSPQLIAQLHPDRNGGVDIAALTAGSGRRVWWRCARGHEWQAPVDRRTAGSGCPYCAGSLPTPQTCLDAVAPEIAAEWHPSRNGARTPGETMPGSDRPVWWRCDRGHEWAASPQARVARGSGCPYCSGKRTLPERSLQACCPTLAAELHPTRNGTLTAADISHGSSRRLWWRCSEGHVWQAIVKQRVQAHSGCPRCARPGQRGALLGDARPDLVVEWHSALNGGPPAGVVAGSHRRCWWRCSTDPAHIWRAQVRNRVKAGSGCPYCAGKLATADTCLAAVWPELVAQWHPERNDRLSPADVLPQSNRRVWWRCAVGHEWVARIANRAHGAGCPRCVNTTPASPSRWLR